MARVGPTCCRIVRYYRNPVFRAFFHALRKIGSCEIDTRGYPQFIDVLHREHAAVDDRVRTSKTWQVNEGWMLAANIAADLDAWCRLLGLYDRQDLKDAEPGTLRYRLWNLPARLIRHARKRLLKISATWPWKEAFTTCW